MHPRAVHKNKFQNTYFNSIEAKLTYKYYLLYFALQFRRSNQPSKTIVPDLKNKYLNIL